VNIGHSAAVEIDETLITYLRLDNDNNIYDKQQWFFKLNNRETEDSRELTIGERTADIIIPVITNNVYYVNPCRIYTEG
jgi:hypothetical protein